MDTIQPINYTIQLAPDLVNFSFGGHVDILLEAESPVDEIVLNILEIAVWSCNVMLGDDRVVCSFRVDPNDEELRIFLPRKLAGPISLQIDYEGRINNKMAGFYRSAYRQHGVTRYIAVTQFEESDARRAFPCLDHPAKKAAFDIEMTVDENLKAISNTSVKEERALGDGKKKVVFHQTPKMSTYLVFLGVGEFEMIESPTDNRVRVATVPGMSQYGGFGLEFGANALKFCEEYYQIPYPLPKMDLIAIPDFAFGAMENWGAITFRENLLLYYPDITSTSGQERICEVIAHEIAHQWFGNLVTPADWKYLWLNESFATYFGFGVVDHYYPAWEVWAQFLSVQTAGALARDALRENFAIEIPGGEHVVINTSTAPIIYSKGGSILRQVEGYIGQENFRKGLSRYLQKHAYGNAASHHLWEAFEAVSDKPLKKMMQSWIEQPGFPLVEAERKEDTLFLHQKRFTYLPDTFEQHWLIPVQVLTFDSHGNSREIDILFDDSRIQIDLGADVVAYKVNSGQTGFYRVKYKNRADLDKIGEKVRAGQLPAEDRWGLQNDLFALVRCGEASIDDYLNFLSHYNDEAAFLPLSSIADNLFQAYLILTEADRKKIIARGRPLLENTLDKIGFHPATTESQTTAILRDQILLQAVIYGSDRAATFAADTFEHLTGGREVHPDIQKSILQVGALKGDDDTYRWLIDRFQSTVSEHERMNILAALGCFSRQALMGRALQYTLEKVPDRNKFIPIVAATTNPHALDYLWEWYLAHLPDLEKFHPLLYERVIAAIIPVCGIKKAKAVREFFNRYIQKKPQTKEVVKLSLERLEINIRMKRA